MCEVVDFSSDIQGKRAHDTTCAFPESHKCEVHHLVFDPYFVSVEDIEKKDKQKRAAENHIRQRHQ